MQNRLIKHCLEKKGTYIDHPFGEDVTTIKVKNKIVAQFFNLNGEPKVTYKCTPDFGDFMKQAHPQTVKRGYHCPPVQQPYFITADTQTLPEPTHLDMIDHAYDTVINKLPKKVQKELANE